MYHINLDAAEKPLDGRQLDRLIDRWLETVAADVEPETPVKRAQTDTSTRNQTRRQSAASGS